LAPALLVDRRGYTRLAAEVFQPADRARIEAAYEHFKNPNRFERHLRQRYGTTTIGWVPTRTWPSPSSTPATPAGTPGPPNRRM